jgi:hypothetical protein
LFFLEKEDNPWSWRQAICMPSRRMLILFEVATRLHYSDSVFERPGEAVLPF